MTDLQLALNSFDPDTRRAALAELVARAGRGEFGQAAEHPIVNMHCHTFFSFNAYGHSPASLAWLARQQGFLAAGIVDFDVLDAVDEFLAACDVAGVRGSAGIETRVFIPEFATREINSPGEPGVSYHMGIGFVTGQVPPEVAPILASMRARAERRNRAMLERVNAHLAPVGLDYEADVLPLTPAGNATERHMLAAYIQAVADRFPDPAGRAAFWADKLSTSREQVEGMLGDYAKFSNLVRGKLMKKGGVGYVTPTPESFPTVEEYHRLIIACGALPTATWLDGTSAGEQDIEELMALLIAKGAAAANIIPDRNWNIADPATRELKVRKLHEYVQLCRDLDLPINVGTEMNSPGNKLVDNFSVPEMAPVSDVMLEGAYFIYGHTVMQRHLGLGYQSAWAQAHMPTRRARNEFYTAVGHVVPPGASGAARLAQASAEKDPAQILRALA
jgi:hypothetical protein